MSFSQNASIVGLNSYAITLPTAGAYFIEGKIQCPQISTGSAANSEVVATIVNGTGPVTLYTGTAGAEGFYVNVSAAAGDVITTTLSSSADIDAPLNAIKCELSIGSGQ